MLGFEPLEERMALCATLGELDLSPPAVHEDDIAAVQKMIVAGDPNGTPPDSPANRVDANTTNSPFAGVGSLFMDLGDGSGFLCTGTLISPWHVLTAAHCLDADDNGTPDFAPQDVSFFLNYGSNFSHTLTASALYVHSDFTGFANPSVLDDLAVVELTSAAPAGVPIYSINTAPFVNIETTTLAGYGTTGDGVSGYISGSASFTVKRTGMNHADAYLSDDEGSGAREGFEWDFDGPTRSTNVFGSPQAFNLTLGNDVETTIGPGDSGGPSFIDDGSGGLLVFGVNTFTATQKAPAPLFGSVGGGIVVAAYADWINSITAPPPATVAGRHLFYNQSAFDGNDAAINLADTSAIAPDKSAYIPGSGQATLANLSNYDKGITGIMVDLAGGGNHASISASDLIFKVGSDNSPSTWASAPAPSAVTVGLGAGVGGSDRVTITWAAGAITDKWLEVQVLANSTTGLSAADVHFWGNLVGETATSTPAGDFARTVAADGGAILANGTQVGVGITNRLDINKSNSITVSADRGPIIALGTGILARINIAGGGPFAPEGTGGGQAIGSELAARAGANDHTSSAASIVAMSIPSLPKQTEAGSAVPEQFAVADSSTRPVISSLQHLEERSNPRARVHLEASEEGIEFGEFDDLLDGLLARLLG